MYDAKYDARCDARVSFLLFKNWRSAGFSRSPWLILGVTAVAVAILLLLLLWNPGRKSSPEDGGPITVYCAAGMRLPVNAVIARYEKECGRKVIPQYGGSGKLLSTLRVEKESPLADLYLAADESYLEEARRQGLVAETIPVARLRPVIAVPGDSGKNIRSARDLLREDVKVALASPEFAAIGRIGQKLLEKAGIWNKIQEGSQGLRGAVSFVGTVTEVANNLKLGTVDAGIVWDATVKQYPRLKVVEDPILKEGIQAVTIGVVSSTRRPTAALRFARYLTARDRGLQEFQRLGWEIVEGDVWEEEPELVFYSGGINRPAIEMTVGEFEAREGVRVTMKYGGCGILVSEMKAIAKGNIPSAFPDMYLACDASFIPPVQDNFGKALNISETEVVFLVPRGNPKNIRTLKDLARPGLRIAMANEEHSALGALTQRILEAEGLYKQVKKNVTFQAPSADPLVLRILGSSPESKASEDVAIVYYSNCSIAKKSLDVIPIGIEKHPLARAIQPYVVSRHSRHRQLALRLREALLSDTSKERYLSVGFRWLGGGE